MDYSEVHRFGGKKTDIFIVYFLQLISKGSRMYSGYFHNTQLIIDNIICINIKNIGGQVWVGNIVKKKKKERKCLRSAIGYFSLLLLKLVIIIFCEEVSLREELSARDLEMRAKDHRNMKTPE